MNDLAAFFHIERWPPHPDLLFWISLTVVVGALLGEAVVRWFALSRILGYSVAGALVAAAGFGLGDGLGQGLAVGLGLGNVQGSLQGHVRLVVDLALALLLFELGSRVSIRWLRSNPMLLATSAAESLLSFGAIVAFLRWLEWEPNLALAAAALTVSASGAVIGRVSSELKSAGQVTERMIVLSALNTLYAVLALKLVIGWLHMDRHGDWVQGISQPLYTFAGSVLVAAILARAVAWGVRNFELRDEHSSLVLLGMVLLALTAARVFGLSTLLVPLLAGVMIRNASERPCIWPRHFGSVGGVLVLILFVVVGSSWSIAAVEAGTAVALGLLAVRAVSKALVLVATARFGGISLRQGLALALALTPLSATTLVMLADLQATHPEVARQLAPVVLSAIAAMALLGPILLQLGLQLAGEYHPAPRAAALERA